MTFFLGLGLISASQADKLCAKGALCSHGKRLLTAAAYGQRGVADILFRGLGLEKPDDALLPDLSTLR